MASSDPLELGPHLWRWGLAPEGEPIRSATGVVQFVRRDGEPLALKLVTHEDEAGQADVLARFGGQGAVRLIDRNGPAMLMERAMPGGPLARLVQDGRDDEAVGVVCEVISRLHANPPAAGDERTVEIWGAGFDRIRVQALTQGADAALIDQGQALFTELCRSQGPRRLLHGDLHHDNILEDSTRGWLAIDPKGVVGELAYEAGPSLRNPVQNLELRADPAIVSRRVAIMSERLELDPERLIGWCFAQAVLSALWSIEDGADPAPGWRMAQAVRPLL